MTLIKFKPASAREILRDSMFPTQVMSAIDTMFNDSLSKFERNVFFTPRVDVVEHEKAFEIHATLPGMKKEDIQIEVENDVLTLSGERKLKQESNESKFHMVESYYGKFSRSFTLPEQVNKDEIEANYSEGILTLTIPKSEVKQRKTTISIK